MCGPGLLRTPGWTHGCMFVGMAQFSGGTWTLSTPSVGPTASPGRFLSTGHGRGWCLAVDVPEIMQRLFQQFSDRRGCSSCCTVVDLAMHSAHCAQDRGVPQVQFLGMVLTCPLLCNDRSKGDSARVCLARKWIHVL